MILYRALPLFYAIVLSYTLEFAEVERGYRIAPL